VNKKSSTGFKLAKNLVPVALVFTI
jgi:hypothetical protein